MPLMLLLPDSEVACVQAVDQGLCIAFSAACVAQVDPSQPTRPLLGHARGVSLLLRAVHGLGLPPAALGRLADARLLMGGRWVRQLALPWQHDGPVQLELAFANRTQLAVAGAGLTVAFDGAPNFSESMAC